MFAGVKLRFIRPATVILFFLVTFTLSKKKLLKFGSTTHWHRGWGPLSNLDPSDPDPNMDRFLRLIKRTHIKYKVTTEVPYTFILMCNLLQVSPHIVTRFLIDYLLFGQTKRIHKKYTGATEVPYVIIFITFVGLRMTSTRGCLGLGSEPDPGSGTDPVLNFTSKLKKFSRI